MLSVKLIMVYYLHGCLVFTFSGGMEMLHLTGSGRIYFYMNNVLMQYADSLIHSQKYYLKIVFFDSQKHFIQRVYLIVKVVYTKRLKHCKKNAIAPNIYIYNTQRKNYS